MLLALWNRFSLYLIGGIALIFTFLGFTWNVKRNAKKELKMKIKDQIYDQISRTNNAARDANSIDTDKWLRERGLLRE